MTRVYVRRIPKELPMGVMTAAQLQHKVAWALLCDVLQQEYGLTKEALRFATAQGGKPYLLEGTVEFNLTHTPLLAAVAVGDAPVGIDAEPENRRISAAVRNRFLQSCPPALAVAAWTAREAYGKMTGGGFLDTSAETAYRMETLFAYRHVITVCSRDTEIAKDVISF